MVLLGVLLVFVCLPVQLFLIATGVALAAAGLVLLGAPYNAQLIPEGCAVVCSYSLTLESVSAAIDALCGKVDASGKLPVKI